MLNQIGIEKKQPYLMPVESMIKDMKVAPVANEESKSYKDMKEFGINIEMPIVVMHVGDQKATVTRGGEILANAKELGIEKIWCMVIDFDYETIETTEAKEETRIVPEVETRIVPEVETKEETKIADIMDLLLNVNGVGAVMKARIETFVETNPEAKLYKLTEIKGIGKKMYGKIFEYINTNKK